MRCSSTTHQVVAAVAAAAARVQKVEAEAAEAAEVEALVPAVELAFCIR